MSHLMGYIYVAGPAKRCKRMAVTSAITGLWDGEYFTSDPETYYVCQYCYRPMKAPRKELRNKIGFHPKKD